MSVASEPLCSTASDLCLRIDDCRRPDAVREFLTDRSRDFIGSTPFTPFWRVCRKAFLTAPYKNCASWTTSAPESRRHFAWFAGRAHLMVRSLLFRIRSQS
jgi:hypothetical protein